MSETHVRITCDHGQGGEPVGAFTLFREPDGTWVTTLGHTTTVRADLPDTAWPSHVSQEWLTWQVHSPGAKRVRIAIRCDVCGEGGETRAGQEALAPILSAVTEHGHVDFPIRALLVALGAH